MALNISIPVLLPLRAMDCADHEYLEPLLVLEGERVAEGLGYVPSVVRQALVFWPVDPASAVVKVEVPVLDPSTEVAA